MTSAIVLVVLFSLNAVGTFLFFVVRPLWLLATARPHGTLDEAMMIAAEALSAKVARVTVAGVSDTIGFEVGAPHKVVVFSFTRRREAFLEIFIAAPGARGMVVVERVTPWVQTLARWSGLYRTHGLERLSHRARIVSDENDGVLGDMLGADAVSDAILFALTHFEAVTLSPAGVSVSARVNALDARSVPFAEMVAALQRLQEALPQVANARGTIAPTKPAGMLWLFLPLLGGVILFVISAVGKHHWPMMERDVNAGYVVGAVGWLVTLLVVWTVLRLTSRRFGMFVLAAWSTSLVVPLCLGSLFLTLNAALDHSPAQTVSLTVVGKTQTRTQLKLQARTPQGDIWEREVSPSRYNDTHVGETIIADVHEGIFGWRWRTWR